MALSCIILEKARYWSKIVSFSYPPCIRHPREGGSHQTITFPFGVGKLEWWVYPTVKKVWRLCLPVLTECTNVTDRQTHAQTDRRTLHDGKGRAWCNHRAAKTVSRMQTGSRSGRPDNVQSALAAVQILAANWRPDWTAPVNCWATLLSYLDSVQPSAKHQPASAHFRAQQPPPDTHHHNGWNWKCLCSSSKSYANFLRKLRPQYYWYCKSKVVDLYSASSWNTTSNALPFPEVGADLRKPTRQPGISEHCETTWYGLVHHAVCLFTSQLSLVPNYTAWWQKL